MNLGAKLIESVGFDDRDSARCFALRDQRGDHLPPQVVEHAPRHDDVRGKLRFDFGQFERRLAEPAELLVQRIGCERVLAGCLDRAGPVGGCFVPIGIANRQSQRTANVSAYGHPNRRPPSNRVAGKSLLQPLAHRRVVGLPNNCAGRYRCDINRAGLELNLNLKLDDLKLETDAPARLRPPGSLSSGRPRSKTTPSPGDRVSSSLSSTRTLRREAATTVPTRMPRLFGNRPRTSF